MECIGRVTREGCQRSYNKFRSQLEEAIGECIKAEPAIAIGSRGLCDSANARCASE